MRWLQGWARWLLRQELDGYAGAVQRAQQETRDAEDRAALVRKQLAQWSDAQGNMVVLSKNLEEANWLLQLGRNECRQERAYSEGVERECSTLLRQRNEAAETIQGLSAQLDQLHSQR